MFLIIKVFLKSLINLVYLNSNHLIFQNKDDFNESSYKFLRFNFIPIIFPTIKGIKKKY